MTKYFVLQTIENEVTKPIHSQLKQFTKFRAGFKKISW